MITLKPVNTQFVSIPPQMTGTELHIAVTDVATGLFTETRVMAASMEWVSPRDLCALRAFIDFASQHVDEVIIDCPTDLNVHNYLERMGLYNSLPDNVELLRPRPVLRANAHDTLIELRRIDSVEAVQEIAEAVWKVASHDFGRGMAKACGTAIAAAAENVLDHSESSIGAFVAAQRYRRTGLEFACIDLGLGIPTTLRRRNEYASLSDVDAVQRALEDKVTSTSEDGRGAGLAELCATVRSAGHSTLTIHSGRAFVSVSDQSFPQLTTPATAVLGTWISIRLKP